MNRAAQSELESIRTTLHGLITELEEIAGILTGDFSGISSERAAASVRSVEENLRRAENALEKLDTETLVPWLH